MKSYIIQEEVSGRLDSVLAEVSELSRSKIQKAAEKGLILVNGEKALKKTLVEPGDKVEVDESVFEVIERSSEAGKLDILFENEDVLVINKPAGILVHDAPGNTDSVLTDSLLAHCPEMAKVGDDSIRPGIVHRLDKQASGVLITAKNQASFEHLKAQFKDRKTTKKYTVLIEGVLDKPADTVTFPIARSKSHGRMAAKSEEQGGREAITHYLVTEQYPHHSLLDVKIDTGRTHQIRVHMFSLGHPVVGDTLYRIRGQRVRDIGRLFLHARELTIEVPDGTTMTFEAPLPDELKAVLEDIPKL